MPFIPSEATIPPAVCCPYIICWFSRNFEEGEEEEENDGSGDEEEDEKEEEEEEEE